MTKLQISRQEKKIKFDTGAMYTDLKHGHKLSMNLVVSIIWQIQKWRHLTI